jgi:hypothetical protein
LQSFRTHFRQSNTHSKRRLIRAGDLQQYLQQTCSFRLLLGYGCASAGIISPYLTSINHLFTSTYKRDNRTVDPKVGDPSPFEGGFAQEAHSARLTTNSPSRTRTYNLAVNSRSLYRLSYRGNNQSSWNSIMSIMQFCPVLSSLIIFSISYCNKTYEWWINAP